MKRREKPIMNRRGLCLMMAVVMLACSMVVVMLACSIVSQFTGFAADSCPLWGVYEKSFTAANTTGWSNAEMSRAYFVATFTRTDDGSQIVLPGFWAGKDGSGNGIWKFRFTPNAAGKTW